VAIDEMPLDVNTDLATIIELLKGEPATWVKLTVQRNQPPLPARLYRLILQRQAKYGNATNMYPRQLRAHEQSRFPQAHQGLEQQAYYTEKSLLYAHSQSPYQQSIQPPAPHTGQFQNTDSKRQPATTARSDQGYDKFQPDVRVSAPQQAQAFTPSLNQESEAPKLTVEQSRTGTSGGQGPNAGYNHDRKPMETSAARQQQQQHPQQHSYQAQNGMQVAGVPSGLALVRGHVSDAQALQQLERLKIAGHDVLSHTAPLVNGNVRGDLSSRSVPGRTVYGSNGASLSQTAPLVRSVSIS
jgi:hypothetical protein